MWRKLDLKGSLQRIKNIHRKPKIFAERKKRSFSLSISLVNVTKSAVSSKCDQIHSFLLVSSHLLKKSLMEKFIFCAVVSQHSIVLVFLRVFQFCLMLQHASPLEKFDKALKIKIGSLNIMIRVEIFHYS